MSFPPTPPLACPVHIYYQFLVILLWANILAIGGPGHTHVHVLHTLFSPTQGSTLYTVLPSHFHLKINPCKFWSSASRCLILFDSCIEFTLGYANIYLISPQLGNAGYFQFLVTINSAAVSIFEWVALHICVYVYRVIFRSGIAGLKGM